MNVRVILVDDHRMVREGLSALLKEIPEIEVIAEADDGRSGLQLARRLSPHLVIMDVSMPDLNGVEATRQITNQLPHIKVLALSMHSDQRSIARMLAAGASGYLPKECAFDELATAIREVMAGRTYLSSAIASTVTTDYVRRIAAMDAQPVSPLTPREREILQLVAEGKSTREIAELLYISIKTVESFRSRIMRKLQLRSVAELTKYAVAEGLTTLDT